MKKTQDHGVIASSFLTINPQKIGYDFYAFLGFFLENGSQYKDVLKRLEQVKECSYTIVLEPIACLLKLFVETRNIYAGCLMSISKQLTVFNAQKHISLEESIKRQISLN